MTGWASWTTALPCARGDALLAITFAPYSEETIARWAQDARDRGLPVVG